MEKDKILKLNKEELDANCIVYINKMLDNAKKEAQKQLLEKMIKDRINCDDNIRYYLKEELENLTSN